MSAALPVVFEDGGAGEAHAHDGEILQLVSEQPYPPGQPLRWTLELPDGSLAMQGKSLGSKRREDGCFDLRARLNRSIKDVEKRKDVQIVREVQHAH